VVSRNDESFWPLIGGHQVLILILTLSPLELLAETLGFSPAANRVCRVVERFVGGDVVLSEAGGRG